MFITKLWVPEIRRKIASDFFGAKLLLFWEYLRFHKHFAPRELFTVQNLTEIQKAVLYGSKPPHNDSLWNAIRAAQYEVNTLDRNAAGKEKAIDTSIVCDINKYLYTASNENDVFVLVMGDKDFLPALEAIRAYKRKTIVAFWNNASGELISGADEYIDLTQNLASITY